MYNFNLSSIQQRIDEYLKSQGSTGAAATTAEPSGAGGLLSQQIGQSGTGAMARSPTTAPTTNGMSTTGAQVGATPKPATPTTTAPKTTAAPATNGMSATGGQVAAAPKPAPAPAPKPTATQTGGLMQTAAAPSAPSNVDPSLYARATPQMKALYDAGMPAGAKTPEYAAWWQQQPLDKQLAAAVDGTWMGDSLRAFFDRRNDRSLPDDTRRQIARAHAKRLGIGYTDPTKAVYRPPTSGMGADGGPKPGGTTTEKGYNGPAGGNVQGGTGTGTGTGTGAGAGAGTGGGLTGGSNEGSSGNGTVGAGTVDAPGGSYSTPSVQENLADITDENNVLNRMARTQGEQAAGRRGLLNSSMGAQAGQAALYQFAMPIASQDAGQAHEMTMLLQQGVNQQTLQTAQIAAEKEQLGMQLDAQERLALQDVNAARERLQLELGSRADMQKKDIGLQRQQARLDREAQQRIAQMNVAAHEREKAASLAAAFENSYTQTIATIMNNPEIPASSRQQYLDHAGQVRDSNLRLVEQMYGIELEWSTPGQGSSGSSGTASTEDPPRTSFAGGRYGR